MLLTAEGGPTTLSRRPEAVTAAPPSLPVISPLLEALGLPGPEAAAPTNGPDRVLQAWHAHQQGIVEQARRLAEQQPRSPTALARLAQALHNAGIEEEAVDVALRVLTVGTAPGGRALRLAEPADPAATYVAASILASAGHLDEAEEALSNLPHDGLHRLLSAAIAAGRGDVDTALGRLANVDGAEASALRGWLLLRSRNPGAALSEFRAALMAGAPSPALLLNMAYAHAALGSSRKALREAKQAVVLAPESKEASLALVGLLVNAGELAAAEEELNRLSSAVGEDADMVLHRGTIELRRGTELDALRVLRSGRARSQLRSNLRAQLELSANIALLQWRTGDLTRARAVSEIRRIAERADGISVAVICLLADILDSTSSSPEVYKHIERASRIHDEDELLPALARAAHLAADFSGELEVAREWMAAHPLDGTAAAAAVQLTGQLEERYEEAAEQGLVALRRTPYSPSLRNNTAYVLAMAGRGREALELLVPLEGENGFVYLATEGLARLAMGDVEAGCELYRRAADLANEVPDSTEAERLKALVSLNMSIAVSHLGLESEVHQCSGLLECKLPSNWRDHPEFLLVEELFRRGNLRSELFVS